MNTEQARSIIAAEDARDRALANIRNAGAMSTDDPRATELLEEAGDAYAVATANLEEAKSGAIAAARRGEMAEVPPEAGSNGDVGQPGPAAPGAEAPTGSAPPEAAAKAPAGGSADTQADPPQSA